MRFLTIILFAILFPAHALAEACLPWSKIQQNVFSESGKANYIFVIHNFQNGELGFVRKEGKTYFALKKNEILKMSYKDASEEMFFYGLAYMFPLSENDCLKNGENRIKKIDSHIFSVSRQNGNYFLGKVMKDEKVLVEAILEIEMPYE